MTPLSLGLVLLSALAHSSWNLMLKKSDNQEVFIFYLLVASAVLLAPLGVTLFWLFPFDPIGWLFVLATVILHVFYFILLGRGYARSEEHTSELQSRTNLVCRLLLEKKKNRHRRNNKTQRR